MGDNQPAKREEGLKLRGTIRPNGYDPPEDMTYEEWEEELHLAWFLYEWSPWGLADILAYGERKFPGKYEQAVKVTGKRIKTLYNKGWLARAFPKEEGLRSERLSPGHHEVLGGMSAEKKRHYLKIGEKLDKDSNGHLTVESWREYVRDQERGEGAKTQTIEPPEKCGQCYGSGKCNRCHGSGEEPHA